MAIANDAIYVLSNGVTIADMSRFGGFPMEFFYQRTES